MSDDTIEMFYISDYEDPETGKREHDKEGVSIVSREDYIQFLHETEWEPCVCNVQGCLSCYLDEKDLWADGYGITCTQLWWGIDPATGKQWNPKAILAERKAKWSDDE